MIKIAALALSLSSFAHVVVIVQENRTPDNLFYALCSTRTCGPGGYDVQLGPHAHPVPLATAYDLPHTHAAWIADCAPSNGACAMSGWDGNGCLGTCPAHPAYGYVSDKIEQPYIDLAEQYGWANYMFQTNQGPSMPAHQYLFGASSAPSATDDALGNFAAENPFSNGCVAPPDARVPVIDAQGREGTSVYPCFERSTLSDLMEGVLRSWRYYAVAQGARGFAASLWLAPVNIAHICGSTGYGGHCAGKDWNANVDQNPADVLLDVGNCALRGVSWVTPTLQNSDHAGDNAAGGPAWVAAIVNAIGQSKCNDDGVSYWNDTAIVVTWDDWGGWYDHVPPAFLPYPQGGYQLGFRVPMIFVSAYTPQGYIDNGRHDFGSIARFIEGNFGVAEGALNFADARASDDLASFHQGALRRFVPIMGAHSIEHFMKQPQGAPDND